MCLGALSEHEAASPATPGTIANSSSTNYNDTTPYITSQLSHSRSRPDGVYVNASLTASKAMLPGELMDAIVRLPLPRPAETFAADISMVIQKGRTRDLFGCQMEIGIAKEKVALYAKRLFDVDVEAKDGARYIRGPGGMKIEPNPSVQLRGCPRDIILGIFGSTVTTAISSCPICLREEKEARDKTDGVSMAMTHKDSEDGRLTLYLGEFAAYNIRKELYE